MKQIYVSGKYSANTESEIAKHVEVAEHASILLMSKGWGVMTPHKNNAFYEKYEKDFPQLNYEWYMQMDLDMLRRCDAIFMLSNWKRSPGAIREHGLAKELGLPIFYEEDGYPQSL